MTAPIFDLQPMSLGDILDRTVRLYRRHFLHTIGITAIPYLLIIPIGAMVGSAVWVMGNPRALQRPDLLAAFGVLIVALIWLSFVSMGALARSVSERFLGGTPTIWGSYRIVLRRTFSLIWGYFLAFLVWGGVGFLGAILVGIATAVSRVLLILGVIGLVVVAAIMFLRLLLITQVIVVEDVRGSAALRRSWDLMRGNFWRAVLILVFTFIVAFVLAIVLQFPVSLLAAMRPSPASKILDMVMGQLAQIVTVPFAGIAFTLLYYDSRIRQEAFDLEIMAQNLGFAGSPEPAPHMTMPTQVATPGFPPRPASASESTAAPRIPPATPPRAVGAIKICPNCGAEVPNIRPTCGKCGTRVPFRPAHQ
jgi:hypothetical protein